MICRAKQCTGFYMIETSVMTELRDIRGSSPKMREIFYSLFPKKMFVETSFPQYVMTDTLSFHFISKCLGRYSIKLLVNLLHNITFFTLHYFNREVLSVFGLFSCKIFFLFVRVGSRQKETFKNAFTNTKSWLKLDAMDMTSSCHSMLGTILRKTRHSRNILWKWP